MSWFRDPGKKEFQDTQAQTERLLVTSSELQTVASTTVDWSSRSLSAAQTQGV